MTREQLSSARSTAGDASADKVRLHYLGSGPQGGHRPGRQDGSLSPNGQTISFDFGTCAPPGG
ncbi:MAG TPA: hypothetical protein VGA04_12210 [Streptosporangiaceae bacterium]